MSPECSVNGSFNSLIFRLNRNKLQICISDLWEIFTCLFSFLQINILMWRITNRQLWPAQFTMQTRLLKKRDRIPIFRKRPISPALFQPALQHLIGAICRKRLDFGQQGLLFSVRNYCGWRKLPIASQTPIQPRSQAQKVPLKPLNWPTW